MLLRILFLAVVLGLAANRSHMAAQPSGASAGEPRLQDFEYPFPVQLFRFTSQRQDLEMAYMDVRPTAAPVGTIVLLHGKNFSGAYWQETAIALRDAGWRVILPDQIGFGKSSKPAHYQFSFHQLAANTRDLLRSLGITQAHLLGHSMGGMIATRYALLYPAETPSLVLVNPLGLEDWKAKGVPYTKLEAAYENELKQTPEKIRAYQLENYYDGKWQPEYDRWVDMLVRFTRSPDYPRMAWNQALTSEMIMTQPVVYEFATLKVPTLLIIGQRDRTAPGKTLVPEAVGKTMGNYPELGRNAAAIIPRSKLVALEGVGHMPHIEAFPRFIAPLKEFLATSAAR